jgi:hypothetical protein
MDDETTGGRDSGRNLARDWGDSPAPAYRDAPPDHPFVPIDPDAPISGHATEFPDAPVASLSPEHDWSAAAGLIFPLLRPVGTTGLHITNIDPAELLATAHQSHAQPIVDDGPSGLSVVYAIAASGFDVIVNGDHLLSWGIGPEAIQDAAIANLAAWSAGAPWTAETSGERKLLSSESGQGWDASRILLPEVRAHVRDTLGGTGRILVGLPERHLLVAGTLRPDDEEFGVLFTEFVIEHSGGADEPIDRRVFELVDGQLVDFAP